MTDTTAPPQPTQAQLVTVLKGLLTLTRMLQNPAQQPGQQDLTDVNAAIAVLTDKVRQLGPVNGALGETIGNLLNGKKTAIGIGGALATQLLGQWPELSGPLSAIFGLGGTAVAPWSLPIFLAMTAWGVLGKMEKWATQPKQ